MPISLIFIPLLTSIMLCTTSLYDSVQYDSVLVNWWISRRWHLLAAEPTHSLANSLVVNPLRQSLPWQQLHANDEKFKFKSFVS